MTRLLKEIESELGSIQFHKKEGYIDVAQAHIPLSNGYIIYAITVYEDVNWDVMESIYEVAVLNSKLQLLELHNELEETDDDNFHYRINGGTWNHLTYNQLLDKCKIVSRLLN
jgi:hypothetical protein